MEVNTVKQSYYNDRRNDAEVIQVLNAISIVSGRLARNMSILAAQRQTEEGGKHYEQNERYGRDHRRATQCRCCY
nr:MAG TPA: hypothetical protein [Caudoviricetes sp.]